MLSGRFFSHSNPAKGATNDWCPAWKRITNETFTKIYIFLL